MDWKSEKQDHFCFLTITYRNTNSGHKIGRNCIPSGIHPELLERILVKVISAFNCPQIRTHGERERNFFGKSVHKVRMLFYSCDILIIMWFRYPEFTSLGWLGGGEGG